MGKKLVFFILFFLFLCINKSLLAGQPQAIFGDWYFFKYVNKENKLLCYIMSIPKNRYDNFSKRGQSFFTIIQEKDSDLQEIYLSYGTFYNKDVINAEIEINKYKFPILTIKDRAWAYNKIDDLEIIKNLKKSVFFNVTINFNGDKNLIDVYSANGFLEGINYLMNNCR